MNHTNWKILKECLLENFVEPEFRKYPSFAKLDYNKGLEIYRYILNKKLANFSESKVVFEALHAYAEQNLNKDLLEKLINKFEPFTKKLFEIIGRQYTGNPNKSPALGWCFTNLFKDLGIPQDPDINQFFKTVSNGKIETPDYDSSHFSTFLGDGTPHGISLHKTYFSRNSVLHNDKPILNRNLQDLIDACIISYLYFTFYYYKDLCAIISDDELKTIDTIQVKNLESLSGGAYQEFIENEISRDGVIQTIESKLKKADILFIEGISGVGKTTIIHQFIHKFPNSCFSYFIDSRDKNTYGTLPILRALCNQVHFYQKQRELSEDIKTEQLHDESFLKDYLASVSIRTNKTVYFIFDGLDEIDENSQALIKEQILYSIKFNRDNVKVLLTGRYNDNLFSKNIKSSSWEVPSLSVSESRKVLGWSVSEEEFNAINKICQNNAGKLVFIRDLIKNSNISISNIIEIISNSIKDIYIYLWDEFYDNSDELQGIVLAIIAFEGKKYSTEKISVILSNSKRVITSEKIKSILHDIPFIRLNHRGTYEFIFEDLAVFARKKLSRFKKVIDNVVIEYLVKNFDSMDSLINLPELYKETGRVDDLIQLLEGERWKQLLQKSESISDVSRVSAIALQAIQEQSENKYIPTILKYSVLKSALRELDRTSVWESEIAANLSLDDDINAINLANIAFLKEDRLKLFASIAKTFTQKKKEIPPKVIIAIRDLYETIDFKNMGNTALEIASLLMYSSPRLALQLIEDLSGNLSDTDNAFDWALAQISLSAYASLSDSGTISREDVNDKVYSKIRNPMIKEFTNAVVYLSENQEFEEIKEKINELESTSQKLFLIKNWIINNKENEKVDQLINLGIDLVIDKSDTYIPKAGDFQIFAEPLPFLQNKESAYEIIKKIDRNILSITATSNTIDLLKIKLLLTETHCNFAFPTGEDKLSSIYEEITKISDPSIRATCLSIYVDTAVRIKDKFPEKKVEIYADFALEQIENSIDDILNQTAHHFEIVQGIITNLVKVYPTTSLMISKKLNKSIDRDNALLESIANYLNRNLQKVEIKILDEFFLDINDLDIKKLALFEILNRINDSDKSENINGKFDKYFNYIDDIIDIDLKFSLYVTLISIYEKEDRGIELVCEKLKSSWKELETSANKIELGFKIAYQASFLDNDFLGKEFLNLARIEKQRPELLLDSPNTAKVFFISIELVIRLFSGLVIKKNYSESDIENLQMVIESLPSEKQQLQLWTSLILRIAGKVEKGFSEKLISTYVVPKLAKIKNRAERIDVILEIVPALYLENPEIPNLTELPTQRLKDDALERVCRYLLTKCLPNELCDDKEKGYPINFETVKKILELVKRMANDYIISGQIEELRNSILSQNTLISSQQIIEIIGEIELIANTKLPDKSNIRHDGYKLLVKALAISIKRQSKITEWELLLSDVNKIPNLSDKIFLWISIASLMPKKLEFSKLKQDLINRAGKESYNLPSFLDTVGRITMILVNANFKKIEGINIRSLLTQFLGIQKNKDVDSNLKERYREILDVAYTTDPEIARALVNSLDKDLARKNTGAYLKNHMNFLEFQSKLDRNIGDSSKESLLLEQNPRYFRKIINKELAQLNASQTIIDERGPKDLLYQLSIASERPLTESENAFSYYIKRFVLKYENTDESKRIIKRAFLELLDVCNLIKLLSIRNADKIQSLFDVLSGENNSDDNGKLIRLRVELGEETYLLASKLLKRNFTANETAEILKVDLEKIKLVKKFENESL